MRDRVTKFGSDMAYSRPHLRLWQLGYLLTAAAVVAASCADDLRVPTTLPLNRLVTGLAAYAVGAGGVLAGHGLLVFRARRGLGRVVDRAMRVGEAEQQWHAVVAFLLTPVWAGFAIHQALESGPLTLNCLAAGAFAALPWLLRLHREVRICESGLLIGHRSSPGRESRIHRVSRTMANIEIQRGGIIALICRSVAGCDWLTDRVAEKSEGDKK